MARRSPKIRNRIQFLKDFGLYTVLGTVEDLLACAYVIFSAKADIGLACVTTGAINLFGLFILSRWIVDLSFQSPKPWAFTLGNMIGTFIAIEFFGVMET